MIAVYYRLARREERDAEALFGNAYRAYMARVPMFVPRFRRRRTLAPVGLLLVWLAPGAAWAQERPWEWGWGMHPMSWMWGAWGIGMMLMMLVFWGVVIAGIVLAIRWIAGQDGRSRPDRALEILRERYSRGEIDKNEFEARRRDLS